MNCHRAQAAISERMDGEHLPAGVSASVEAHLEGCIDCRAFAERAARVRTAVRIRPAEPIPDLVAPIMAEVARTSPSRMPPLPRRRPVGRPRPMAPVAAALAIGVMAGSLSVGGPWQDREGTTSATAAHVIRRVGVAARHVQAYHATFTIEEQGYSAAVPERSFEGALWFAAPGRYRLEVRDTTDYPTDDWTPTDLRRIEVGTAVLTTAPTGCPAIFTPAECPTTQTVTHDRSSYSIEAPVAADLVVPLDVLANPRGLTVVRTGTVLGREALLVRTTFARAAPLFPFLELGGSWRGVFPEDRVDLWVDANEWSPLRWTVYPADDPARRDWELRFGLPSEPTDTPILDVAVTALDHDPPDPDLFDGAPAAPSIPVNDLPERVGFQPVTPTATTDLTLTAASAPHRRTDAPQSLLTYSSGLTYLQVAERRSWHGSALFGPVDLDAERVDVGGGVAYYEPADGEHGRRLAIHTGDRNLYLETNLSREELLAVAASLPLEGEALPPAWFDSRSADARTHRLTLAEARARTSFAIDLPDALPGGYVLASVERSVVQGVEGLTLGLRQRDTDLGAGPVRIHLEMAGALPPAAATDQETVDLGEREARWTPSQGRLEWIDHGIYHSIDGPGVELRILAAIAAAVEAAA